MLSYPCPGCGKPIVLMTLDSVSCPSCGLTPEGQRIVKAQQFTNAALSPSPADPL